MISLSKSFDHWATHIGVSIEKSMQIVWPKRIGEILRPREIVDANKGVIRHGEIDALCRDLTSQPGMAVAIELQAEWTPGRHA